VDTLIKKMSEFPSNSDTISRQAAIDCFVLNVGFHDEDGYPIEDTDELRKIWTEYFDGIPSTEPKTGKWIIKDDTERFIAQCNCCRYIEDSRRIKNFCPNCGADMREKGENNETN